MRRKHHGIRFLIEIFQLPFLVILALVSRLALRSIDIGLGPLPMINNKYHKKALNYYGYSAETFVDSVYFITHDFDHKIIAHSRFMKRILRETHFIFLFAIFRYRCLYIYFNGGPLYSTIVLWRFEPFLYRLAGVKTVVMPYGGDVQELLRTPNLMFRHVMSQDYPLQRNKRTQISQKIDLWIANADHVISGCDWVDYMHFWHTLMVAHFSIDIEQWPAQKQTNQTLKPGPLQVLHAPNHKAIKGTNFFVKAVEELCAEGHDIELVMAQGVPNDEIRELISSVDIVADQLIIGWYAMFSIEAMAMGKPVLCYLRKDLKQLYIDAGLIGENEIPLINCSASSVKSVLKKLLSDREILADAGRRGPAYVKRHHSIEAVGQVFNKINQSIGMQPSEKNGKI